VRRSNWSSIEAVEGGTFDDTLVGGNGANTLLGGAGNDSRTAEVAEIG
jgi:Ca2+-binding RTX toxin-like protein